MHPRSKTRTSVYNAKQTLQMRNLFATILLFSVFLASCSTNDKQVKNKLPTDTSAVITKHTDNDTINNGSYFKIDKDSITVLPFEITITLSPKAKDKIINSHETIIVNVTLTGTPKDKKLVAEDGDFYVAEAEKEITYGQVATFDNIKFSRKVYDELTDKNVSVMVFFYSGRKSSKDNLLNGTTLSDSISNIVNKHFELTGKLIYGDD